jgi:hypothetical protein
MRITGQLHLLQMRITRIAASTTGEDYQDSCIFYK